MNETTLMLLASAVARAVRGWPITANAPTADCDLCGDTGCLSAPAGVWRPWCPRPQCLARRTPDTRVQGA